MQLRYTGYLCTYMVTVHNFWVTYLLYVCTYQDSVYISNSLYISNTDKGIFIVCLVLIEFVNYRGGTVDKYAD